MAVLTDAAADLRGRTGARVAIEGRKAKPVKWWAVIGSGFLVLQVYVYAAWILSDDFTRTDPGPDEAPDWMMFLIRTQEVLVPLLAIGFLYFFFYKPWRHTGRVSLDGLFCLCMLGMYWMDPMVNYTQHFGTYNSNFVNMGSWTEQIPGWMAPGGSTFAEPLLWAGPTYVWALMSGIFLSNMLMRKAKGRWPQLGTAGLIGGCVVFFVLVDTLLEMVFLRLGIYTYAGSPEHFTLFSGKYYQFPLWESLFWGAAWAAWASVRYFTNDKGETVAERGIDEVRATHKQKTAIRGLALLGLVSTIFMAYNVVWAFVALNQGPWPKDITERSYFTDELCGEGTDYQCPGPDVPIPRPNSAHVTPDGDLAPAAD